MTLGTVTQLIKEDLSRLTASDDDRIWRAIIRTQKDHQNKLYYFNEETDTWTTVIGKKEYGSDATGIEGAGLGWPENMIAPLVIQLNDSGYNYIPLISKPLRWIRRYFTDDTLQGTPEYWSFFNEEIIFNVEPILAYVASIDYIKDVGLPTYSFSGSTWSFVEEDGSTVLAAAYTNAWFEEAEDLLRYGAQLKLGRRFRDDKDRVRVSHDYRTAVSRINALSKKRQTEAQLTAHY